METKPIRNPKEDKDFETIVADKKKLKKRNTIIAVVAALAVIVIGTYLCFTQLFVLRDVKVEFEGRNIPYTEEQIKGAVSLEDGTPLHEIDENKIRENIKYTLPYVNVEIKKEWPSTVIVKAVKKQGRYYMTVNGRLYILSSDLVVLEETDDIQKIEMESLISLKLSDVSKCVEGEIADVPEDISECLFELVSCLEKYDMLVNISEIDLSNKFDINLNYGSKYFVKFGDIKNAEQKVQLLKVTVEDKIKSGESGRIDVTDEKMGVYKPF